MTALFLLGLFGALLLVLAGLIGLALLAIHWGFKAPRIHNTHTPKDYGLAFTELHIPLHNTTTKRPLYLSGWWLTPSQPSHTSVLIMHGWGANKSSLLALAKPFVNMGLNVCLIDAHNHGDSSSRGTSTMPKFAEDIQTSAHWLKFHKPQACQQLIVVGHSVGAAATLLAASQGMPAHAFIALASFAHPKLMMQRELKKLNAIPGLVKAINAYVQWVIGHKFDDIAPLTRLPLIKQPALLVHGNADRVIPINDFSLLCQSARPNQWVDCETIEGADHDSIDKIEAHFARLEHFIKQAVAI